jgi:hypothetical protein
MILVLMCAGIVAGIAAATFTLLAGQGIGLALLAYSGGGMAGMVAAGGLVALCRGPAGAAAPGADAPDSDGRQTA